MEINTTSLLPYVLDLLSRQPDLCTSLDALCEQIQDVVMDDVIRPFGSLKRAVEFSVELGMNLGLLLLSEKRVRMPFNFRAKSDKKQPKAAKPKDKEMLSPEQDRHVIKHLAKTLKSPRRSVINQKAKPKVKTRRPKGGAKSAPRNTNVNKVRRSPTTGRVQYGSAKKPAMAIRKTVGRNPIARHLTTARSRRY